MALRSRRVTLLTRREEKKKIKKTIYLSLASIVLLALLLTYGAPVLGKFADVLDTLFGKKAQEQAIANSGTLQPPILDDLPNATNSARIVVRGFAQEGGIVQIFLNGDSEGKTKSEGGKFDFRDLSLKNGDNEIKAKLVSGSLESDFSQSELVKLDTQEPALVIESPSDGQSFSGVNRISVSGKTDSDAQVYANGFLANVGADGKFEAFVTISEGENTIEIKAIDSAGNSKTEKRKVHFSK